MADNYPNFPDDFDLPDVPEDFDVSSDYEIPGGFDLPDVPEDFDVPMEDVDAPMIAHDIFMGAPEAPMIDPDDPMGSLDLFMDPPEAPMGSPEAPIGAPDAPMFDPYDPMGSLDFFMDPPEAPMGAPEAPMFDPHDPMGSLDLFMDPPEAPMGAPEAPMFDPHDPMGSLDLFMDPPEALMGAPEAPMGSPEAPMGSPEAPMGSPEAPMGSPEAPMGSPEAPMGSPEAPMGSPEAPMGSPEAPMGAPEAPIDAPHHPKGNLDFFMDNGHFSRNESDALENEPHIPVDEPDALENEPHIPVDEPDVPMDNVEVPIDHVDSPHPYNFNDHQFQTQEVKDALIPWYKVHPAPDYRFEEYIPVGRHHNDEQQKYINDPFNAWYINNGIPHEVSTPIPGEWIGFKRWMMQVARGWWRTIEAPAYAKASFPGTHSVMRINFFRVMRYRIARQRQLNFWTYWVCMRQDEALTNADNDYNRRLNVIMFSLMGADGIQTIRNSSQDIESLARFIRSGIVVVAFKEYYRDYLSTHPDTLNSRWAMVQPWLADPALAGARRRDFGRGSVTDVLDKSRWSHEQHATRFIITLYHLTSLQFYVDDIEELLTSESSWRAYFFSRQHATDTADRYWFGYALLQLMTMSWQHNLAHPTPHYARRLVPALYKSYKPKPHTFGPISVGQIDLSPASEWKIDDDYVPAFDVEEAEEAGFMEEGENDRLWEEESTTELGDNGNALGDINLHVEEE
ncbi:hypothetical protein F4804DRAFT_350486 [Jackrogersella minutella]|nr:hypothetical protein F4804DRAFT_350486 [Jackrogersella minutella]